MMGEASDGAESLDMIELTLCRKCADKDGGGIRVKGVTLLSPYSLDKEQVPHLKFLLFKVTFSTTRGDRGRGSSDKRQVASWTFLCQIYSIPHILQYSIAGHTLRQLQTIPPDNRGVGGRPRLLYFADDRTLPVDSRRSRDI